MSLFARKMSAVASDGEAQNVPLSEKIYGTLPTSLKETKLLVKAECEDPEVQAARAEIVKSKSVHELSQVTSLSDFPVPEAIENMLSQKMNNGSFECLKLSIILFIFGICSFFTKRSVETFVFSLPF